MLAETNPAAAKDKEKLAKDHADALLVSAAFEMLLARENGRIDAKNPHLDQARSHLQLRAQLYPKDARIRARHPCLRGRSILRRKARPHSH